MSMSCFTDHSRTIEAALSLPRMWFPQIYPFTHHNCTVIFEGILLDFLMNCDKMEQGLEKMDCDKANESMDMKAFGCIGVAE